MKQIRNTMRVKGYRRSALRTVLDRFYQSSFLATLLVLALLFGCILVFIAGLPEALEQSAGFYQAARP